MLANRMSHERTFRDQSLLASILFRLLREGQPGAHRRPGIGPACPPGLGPPCSYASPQRSAGRGLSAGSSSVQGTSRWSRFTKRKGSLEEALLGHGGVQIQVIPG